MTEQQYRVHACSNAEPHEPHEFRGTYRKPSLPGVDITETFQCEGVERPVPTTDEPERRSFIVTPNNDRYDAFDIEDALINSRSFIPEGVRVQQHPSVPTPAEPDWQIARDRTLVARLRDDHGPVRERMSEAADRIERLESAAAPSVPTREQIAEALRSANHPGGWWPTPPNAKYLQQADAVLREFALIQKGTDR